MKWKYSGLMLVKIAKFYNICHIYIYSPVYSALYLSFFFLIFKLLYIYMLYYIYIIFCFIYIDQNRVVSNILINISISTPPGELIGSLWAVQLPMWIVSKMLLKFYFRGEGFLDKVLRRERITFRTSYKKRLKNHIWVIYIY